jgi:Domain of unknown function (DUF4391)
MEPFELPHTTKVGRVIPKNAFDTYTNSKQKKLFADKVLRITWLNKIATSTVNLESGDVKEIQIIRIELKVKDEIKSLIEVIEKAMIYHLIFVVTYEDEIYFSTSAKHPHPTDENNAVIDWTFKTDWVKYTEQTYTILLKKNLDAVYYEFCAQISSKSNRSEQSLSHLVQYRMHIESLEKEISQLKLKIRQSNQFKIQVELNMLLNQKTSELTRLIEQF